MVSLTHSARRMAYLIGLEARETRPIFGFVAILGLVLTLGWAWWISSSGGEVAFGWSESVKIGWMVQLLLIPILADVFSATEARSGQRTMASLPVRSGQVLLARSVLVVGAAVTLFLVFTVAWWAAVAVAPPPTLLTAAARPTEAPGWSSIWMLGGSPVPPVMVYTGVCIVAMIFRSGLSATVTGLCIIVVVALRPLWEPDLLFSLLGSIAVVMTLWASFSLRGRASRSCFARCLRAGSVVAAYCCVTAGATEYQDWQRMHFGFNDPEATIGNWPAVAADGTLAALALERDNVRLGWVVDLASGEVERFDEAHIATFVDNPTMAFHRGLDRQQTATIGEAEVVDSIGARPVVEERWTSTLGGPPMTVTSVWVISPRRRLPHVAYYVDEERWFHRVDLRDGSDDKMDIQIDGEVWSAGVDEDGRWLFWNQPGADNVVLRGVNLETGERFEHVPGSMKTRIHGSYFTASFGGGPVLTAFSKVGPSHFTVREGVVVPLPFVRRYSKIADVDGDSLIGCTDDGGVYLIGAGGEETMVLRKPR